MNESEKKTYIQLADKEKKRYDAELANYVPPKSIDWSDLDSDN